MRRIPGSTRIYNMLRRSGFATVEELAALPEACVPRIGRPGTGFRC
jgi:hypothetical protein